MATGREAFEPDRACCHGILAATAVAAGEVVLQLAVPGRHAERLARELGQRLFRRNFVPWKWLDYPLRTVKYALLLDFVSMLSTMRAAALDMFVHSDYNRIRRADVPVFAHITPRALAIVLRLPSPRCCASASGAATCAPMAPCWALRLLSPLRVTA